jgi:hypothetical protein
MGDSSKGCAKIHAAFGQSFKLTKDQFIDVDDGRAAIRILGFREGYRIDEVSLEVTVKSRKPFTKRLSARSNAIRFRYTDDEHYELKVLKVDLQDKWATVNIRRL